MRKPYLVAGLCLLLTVALLAWGFQGQDIAESPLSARYAMVLTEDKGTAVMQFKQGAMTAAEELGIALSVYTTDQGSPADEQIKGWLAQLDAQAVQALILPPCQQETFALASELAKKKRAPLVVVGQEEKTVAASVLFDPVGQGRALGEALRAKDPSRQVAVFLDDSAQAQARLDGLREAAQEIGYLFTGRPDDTGWAIPPDMPVVALTPEWSRALSEEGARSLWAVDPGDDRVALLQRGKMEGILMDMPYALGYLAVVTAYEQAGGGEAPRAVHAPSRMVTPETMYLSENIKLMFPLLQ